MLRIENWSAILASWLVILANLQAVSTEAELPANYRKVQARANEDKSLQATELNATPLNTHTRAVADSRVKRSGSVLSQNVRGDEWSTDNPQLGAGRIGDEAKSLKTIRPVITRRGEPIESDQSDYPDFKETRKKGIDALKSPSVGDEASSVEEDPTPSKKEKTEEWSRLVSSKALEGNNARRLSDSRSSTSEITDPMYSWSSRNPIEHSAVRENRLLNRASELRSKSADRKSLGSFALKREQLQANSEARTNDDVPERTAPTEASDTVHRAKEYRDGHADFGKDVSQNTPLVRNSRRFIDSENSKLTETRKVTRQSTTSAAGRRETSIDKKSHTHKLTDQRAVSTQSRSWKDNAEITGEMRLPETEHMSEFPIVNNITKLPNPETTAIPSAPFGRKSEYSPGELTLAVNRDGETEVSTTAWHEDKSPYDSIKKERRAFGKLARRTTEEPTRLSFRAHWNEEGDALEALRDTTVAIEFHVDTFPMHSNTPANAIVKQRKSTVRENPVDHVAKEESRLLRRELVNARFHIDKLREVSKEARGTNKAEEKDRREKDADILHPTGRVPSPGGEASTAGDTHWNVEQTDVTIGPSVKIDKILASGNASTASQDADPSAHDPPVKRRQQRKQLLDILGRNIAFSGSSTQRPRETNFRAGRSNVLDEADTLPTGKRQVSATRVDVLQASTDRITSNQDRLVVEAPEKGELNRNEDVVPAKVTFPSQRASGELDYSQGDGAEPKPLETGLSSENKAIPRGKHTEATFEAPNGSHSTPDYPEKQSRSSIMRERNASDARREMTGRLTESKAASNMEREDRPSIAARNVEVPYTNSAAGHPGYQRDQWIARNPKIERGAVLNLTRPRGTREESSTDQETNEKFSSTPLPLCDEQEGKKECFNEDDKQDVYGISTQREVGAAKASTEEILLVSSTTSENQSRISDESLANEAARKYIHFNWTTERERNGTTNSGSYIEHDNHVNLARAKEASVKGVTTPDPNGQDDSDAISSAADVLPERHSRVGRLWHALGTENLTYTGNGSGSTLAQESDTERQQLDRASSDPAVGEEYNPLGTAVTPTKIDLPPQTSSSSTTGIPSSSDRANALETDKLETHGVDTETLAVASTKWSGTHSYDASGIESTTLRETLSKNEESLVEKKHNQTSDSVLEMSTEHWLNIEKEATKSGNSSLEVLDQWPVKHSAVVEGDLVLGGLMMVHEREDTITCGPVMPQGGVQALEAMLYTLDNVNELDIVPGVKIGAHILDDCDKDTYGLEMAVDFIKGSISNIDGAEYHCNKTAVRKVISGVVGAASSVTSIQVANLLRLFRIPQVSFFSTSPELSNKQRFEYFTRTIPSDHYQVKAMVDIIRTVGWSYVSIIYEESNYGIKAFEELEELLGKYNICIAIKEKLVKDSGVAEETAYDNIVLKLLTKPRAKGCIIFGSDQEVAGVMRAVRRCNATGAFSWIGSDGWSARDLVSNGNEPEVEGTLSVQPQANPVRGFEEYFLNLTVENNRRNPWFVEFWEDHFQCRYPNSSRTPYNQKYTNLCTTKERLTKQDTAFEDQLQFVSDAVMAFAYAFRDMHNDLCHGKAGLCDAMKPTRGTELLKYLRKVDFEGLSGDEFRFDKNGDGPARYNIIHFKQTDDGKYKWIRVGKYLEGELNLDMSEIQFKRGHHEPPESVCSLPCEVGQAKKYVEGERCCWHCFNCTQYQIRHPKDETQCIPCRQGTVPDETHFTCRDIPEEFLRPESGWAIGAMSFSATGMLITFFVCGVFLRYNDTPVVRASGRELSYVLLSGILLCYLVTFALVLRPTDIVCGIQRFAAGFCFTVVYAALLTKTNRISRIFNASKHSAKRPSFISPRSQLIICAGLVFVQILINGVWMVIDPARAMHHYPTREDNLLVCNSYIDASYMIAFAYPIMLIVVCTVYAVLTRKIPEAFNESKHIGFTMYTTCVIWLAFVPLYFGTGNNVALRITSMSVTISLSASVTIVCLFSPKLYIILIRPERNVRQSMMPFRCGTTKSSAGTTNASSMIAPVTLTAATCDQNKAVKKHIATTIDCSTQSEYYELEVKDQKNGKPPPAVMSRSTQTPASDKETLATATTNKEAKEGTAASKKVNNNNARIGNGPLAQSDVSL